jgi:outer membrane protein
MKLVIALMDSMFLASGAFAKVAVGKVDVQKVLVTVAQGQSVRDQLKKSFDEKQKVLKEEEDKIRKLQDDYQKKASVLNDKEKSKKEKEIQDRIVAIQQKTANYQKEIQEMENKLKMPLLEKIKAIVDDVAKNAEIDLVYEAATSPIIYAKEEKDLTDEVVKLYNKKFPK